MQNIDPLYFLTPITVIAFSFGLPIYLHYKKKFTVQIILYSLIAYAGAIVLKEILQFLTYRNFVIFVAGNPTALGVYIGLQTVVFEVGGAYAVAYYAVKRAKLVAQDAVGFGLSLATWENGVLIGGSALIGYAYYYLILSGSGEAAQGLFQTLSIQAPSLFYPSSAALPLIGYSILERFSSLLIHLSWGYLCVLSVSAGRKLLFLIALPMGLIDFLIPFVSIFGVARFELIILVLSTASLIVSYVVTRKERTGEEEHILQESTNNQD
jgi:hypothetical protein